MLLAPTPTNPTLHHHHRHHHPLFPPLLYINALVHLLPSQSPKPISPSPPNLQTAQIKLSGATNQLHKMCNSKLRTRPGLAQIDGRPVLQPTCNRVVTVDPSRPLKKSVSFPSSTPLPPPPPPTTPPLSAANNKRSKDPNSLNSSTEKPNSPKFGVSAARVGVLVRKKTRRNIGGVREEALFDVKAPGSLAAAQREQATMLQAQRKMRIAHYGRAVAKGETKVVPPPVVVVDPVLSVVSSPEMGSGVGQEEKRCSFITTNSDPLYVAYHDEEWGVPVHDDKMLFELLVLSGAQVGLDWTTILKKRDAFGSAFSGFDVDEVSKLTEKQIASVSVEYGIDVGRVRGIIDNSNRILEVRKEFGSLNKYLWGFVNHKPISTQYRSCRKIPVKTSKSEAISKDMVRRGFRFVGPTIIHSFMQAAGLTNDHLVTCPRHSCIAAN